MNNIEMKKGMVINCINLGMDLYRAYIIAGLSQKEIILIEKDEEFLQLLEVEQVIMEKQLLEKYHQALEVALEKGNTEPIKWMLGKINPDKWGDKKNDIVIPGKIVIDSDDAKLL